jgi:hypothetical protein
VIRLLIARIAMVLRHAPQSFSLCWLRGGLYGGWLAGVGCLLATASVLGAEAQPAAPPNLLLDAQLRHVRREGEREWADFPEQPESNQFSVRFEVPEGTTWRTLRLRQVDVRQSWSVRLNDRELGSLVADENDQIRLLSIPPGTLRPEENELTIAQGTGSTAVDDIRVGAAELLELDAEEFLRQASLRVRIEDEHTGAPLPGRLTITDAAGVLQPVLAGRDERLAVRTGVVYCGDGEFEVNLPPGEWTVSAGRGFEYSLDTRVVTVSQGEVLPVTMTIRRQVSTPGWVACDPHVHTLTHSGHGDATVEERMLTIAGEGIELPIATDHNRHVDYEPFARQAGVRRWFTPVAGNEVTTPHGHFNIWPVLPEGTVPDHRTTDWRELFRSIQATPQVRVVILNHARDLHAGVRPFGTRFYHAGTGQLRDGRVLRANAMEVVNSGAIQTDPLRLVHDWMTQLNAGRAITPVGASDSHDVSRSIVGQGRTYIRVADDQADNVPVVEAATSLAQGRVLVSYGLLADLQVDDRFGPGEVVPAVGAEIACRLRVLGPAWSAVHTVRLYANGELLREQKLTANRAANSLEPGVLWSDLWQIPIPRHDVHLVLVALGPGVTGAHWKTARPYQPTDPRFEPHTLGISGAIWLDVDGDGRGTAAREIAARAWGLSGGDLSKLLEQLELAGVDAAVAAQAASWCAEAGVDLESAVARRSWQSRGATLRLGFERYLEGRTNPEGESPR